MNDKLYKILLFAAALIMPIVCGGVIYALVTDAYEAFEHFGFFKFLTSKEWSYTEGAEQYGALPFITGTLMTTLLALIFCIPFSLPVSLFVGEYFKGTKVASVNTMNMDGKNKRRGMVVGKTAKTKKAIVQLTEDSKDIEIFAGL